METIVKTRRPRIQRPTGKRYAVRPKPDPRVVSHKPIDRPEHLYSIGDAIRAFNRYKQRWINRSVQEHNEWRKKRKQMFRKIRKAQSSDQACTFAI